MPARFAKNAKIDLKGPVPYIPRPKGRPVRVSHSTTLTEPMARPIGDFP
jgi:hypothetical protein